MCFFFPETVPLFLWIIRRPRRQQFSLELLSNEETLAVKTVDSEVCGLSTVSGDIVSERDLAVEDFKCIVLKTQGKISHSQDGQI